MCKTRLLNMAQGCVAQLWASVHWIIETPTCDCEAGKGEKALASAILFKVKERKRHFQARGNYVSGFVSQLLNRKVRFCPSVAQSEGQLLNRKVRCSIGRSVHNKFVVNAAFLSSRYRRFLKLDVGSLVLRFRTRGNYHVCTLSS